MQIKSESAAGVNCEVYKIGDFRGSESSCWFRVDNNIISGHDVVDTAHDKAGVNCTKLPALPDNTQKGPVPHLLGHSSIKRWVEWMTLLCRHKHSSCGSVYSILFPNIIVTTLGGGGVLTISPLAIHRILLLLLQLFYLSRSASLESPVSGF